MRIEHTIDIDAPIASVFALTLDVERLPEISPTTMTAVERLEESELAAGSQVRIKQPGQAASIWTVQEIEAPTRFVWSAPLGPARMVATHELTERTGGTTNRLVLHLTGPGAGLLGWLLGKRMRRVLATENAGLKRVAESS